MSEDVTIAELVYALNVLDLTADKLLTLIRADLGRGLVDSARNRLAFVDVLRAAKGGEA